MSQAGLFTFDPAAYEANAFEATVALSEGLMRTMCIARLLVEHGRSVDMAGLDRGVGLLVAKALDLPPESGRNMRLHLVTLIAEVDELTAALRKQLDGPSS